MVAGVLGRRRGVRRDLRRPERAQPGAADSHHHRGGGGDSHVRQRLYTPNPRHNRLGGAVDSPKRRSRHRLARPHPAVHRNPARAGSRIALHRAQHRVHPRGVRAEQDRRAVLPRPADGGRRPTNPRQPADDKQHPTVGLQAAVQRLPPDSGDQAVLRLQGRRRRQVHHRRRVPPGIAVRARGGAGASRPAVPDVGEPETGLYARHRHRHEPGHGVHAGGQARILRQRHPRSTARFP